MHSIQLDSVQGHKVWLKYYYLRDLLDSFTAIYGCGLEKLGHGHDIKMQTFFIGDTQMSVLGIRSNFGVWPWTWPCDLNLLRSQSQTEMLLLWDLLDPFIGDLQHFSANTNAFKYQHATVKSKFVTTVQELSKE